MKKTYISPETSIIMLEISSHLMDISRLETEISEDNAGLVKGDASSSYTPRNYNVWEDDWSQ